MQRPRRAAPVVTRSKLVLEVASELVGDPTFRPKQARLQLRGQGAANPWELDLFASDAPGAIDDVARGDVQLAIVNPAAVLALAYRGTGPFRSPIPVRTITVIPSRDEFLFAIHERTGITSLGQVREERYPLKISIREQSDHAVYLFADTVFRALGFSLDDVVAWGGRLIGHGFPPPDAAAVDRGEIDAIVDESVKNWGPFALAHGMRLLHLEEPLLLQLEAMGFRRAYVTSAMYPAFPSGTNIPTLDFSGWPVFTHAEVSDDFVQRVCAALEARKDRIPWQGDGPLPLERMCLDTPDAPLTAPLHPAAARFWQEQGYIP